VDECFTGIGFSLFCWFVHNYLLVKVFYGVGWGLVAFERMPLASGEPDPVRTPGAPVGPAFGSCRAGSLLAPLFGCVIPDPPDELSVVVAAPLYADPELLLPEAFGLPDEVCEWAVVTNAPNATTNELAINSRDILLLNFIRFSIAPMDASNVP
jgi:hypothetical protein